MRLRNAANGAIVNVDDELGESMLGGAWVLAVDVPDGTPDESWKVAELVAYAKQHGVTITGDARRKADVLDAITAAAAAAAAAAQSGNGSNEGGNAGGNAGTQ
ncbi:DUF7302 family protein [Williamsia deligens]|uniref:Lsr2 protein n=1 Tax=Williamsia deligens TaxID=321325 RepID=A0ABW3GC82_9NOCA|nr:hypothetical protein [Williamsia deligens]MCP2196291.1 hypothetical protein [Williamsia deligens]